MKYYGWFLILNGKIVKEKLLERAVCERLMTPTNDTVWEYMVATYTGKRNEDLSTYHHEHFDAPPNAKLYYACVEDFP